MCTSVGVGGRGFLDPFRRDGLDVKPINSIIEYISRALVADLFIIQTKGSSYHSYYPALCNP